MMKSRARVSAAEGITSIDHALSKEVVDKLQHYYMPWIDAALEPLDDWDIWQRPHDGANSIANLMLHLEGNVRQWILHGIRGDEDIRKRDDEFRSRDGYTKLALLIHLRKTVNEACEVIESLSDHEELLRKRTIQDRQSSTYNAVFHVVEHFAYHTGQIVYIAKMISGRDLGFYDL
ncbi:DUF1572 domain-containing protein [bacterium]|nr:DUF1572 domain-containing protein [bacterium]